MVTNNRGIIQDLNLLFIILLGTIKNFFEIYRQFGHVPSQRFATPVLMSSISCLRLFLRLPFISILPFIFSSVTCFRKQFQRKM
jgi:hypothetical protein